MLFRMTVPLICATICALPPVRGQEGSWTQKTSMPGLRGEAAAAVVDGKIYAIGGNVAGKAIERIEAYDPASDRWTPRAPLPEPRDHMAVTVLGGKIYAFGGFVSAIHAGAGAVAFEYDPKKDSWRALASMKVPRGSGGAAVLDGKIHVVGGRSDPTTTVAAHEIYDPANDTWTEAAPLPLARDHMAVVVADGKLHVIGGRTGGGDTPVSRHDVYDSVSKTWASAPEMPAPRSAVGGTLYKGMIVVAGGEFWLSPQKPSNVFTDVWGYDLAKERWVTLVSLPSGRHGYGVGVIGESVYLIGGSLTPGGAGITDQLVELRLP